jgi:hypothetical protein
MTYNIKSLILTISVAVMVGCTSTSAEITPTYASPVVYQSFNCYQLSEEIVRINNEVVAIEAQIDKRAIDDESQTAVGVVLSWPTLLFLGNDEAQNAEHARLRDGVKALQEIAIRKECSQLVADIVVDIGAAEVVTEEMIEPLAEE